ncbi:MAG: hypothetical protein GX025_10620, partial [Clostridiales bacterium]|nr:hypothetical protein [Clostridiales bacterium]
MKKVSYEDYLRLGIVCRTPDGFITPLENFFDAAGGSLSATEILQIEEIYAPDRLNIVLREEFLNT